MSFAPASGTREQWLAAREEPLAVEKEHAGGAGDRAAKAGAPVVRLEKEYRFQTEGGQRTLAELFHGRSQLLVYNIVSGPSYTGACPGCSSLADRFDGGVVHLNHRDVTFVCISRAPLEKLQAYKRRMGWKFLCVSSSQSDLAATSASR